MALALKAANPAGRVIGITMDRGAAMYLSLAAGHPIEVTKVPSLADSLGGGIGIPNNLLKRAKYQRRRHVCFWNGVQTRAAASPQGSLKPKPDGVFRTIECKLKVSET